jgi:predicted nucleic acid-binding protein
MPTSFLDTSALLAAQVEAPSRAVVLEVLAGGDPAAACGTALAEALVAIDRLTDEPILRADLEDGLRRLWDHLYIVPVDPRLLDSAAALCRQQPLRLQHALHLAAATWLPAPVRFVTFDPAQIPVGLALGLDVVSL